MISSRVIRCCWNFSWIPMKTRKSHSRKIQISFLTSRTHWSCIPKDVDSVSFSAPLSISNLRGSSIYQHLHHGNPPRQDIIDYTYRCIDETTQLCFNVPVRFHYQIWLQYILSNCIGNTHLFSTRIHERRLVCSSESHYWELKFERVEGYELAGF